MSDPQKPPSWWHTLPGIMTGLAAVVTAAAGLIVALAQTGWFEPGRETRVPPSANSGSAMQPVPVATPSLPAESPGDKASKAGALPAQTAQTLALPALRDYTLAHQGGFQKTSFTLLKAEVVAQTAETAALTVRVRAWNQDRFDINVWDRSFRLAIDGVPMAPANELNELVESHAAKEANLIFVIPRSTRTATLKILHASQSAEFALDLAPVR